MTPPRRLLLINTGSSSVKISVWENDEISAEHRLARDAVADVAGLIDERGPFDAVVHRVVHGGQTQRHTVITSDVEKAIRAASPLAPLHNPIALEYIAAARAACGPAVPQVAAFDTAFFAQLPAWAAGYALPTLPALSPEIGPVRRYGFHGLAHAHMARRCAQLDPRAPRRLVTLQLGAGCSAAAIVDGRAVDTSMGFSPSEGLMMATRAGDVDPGLIVHLLRTRGMTANDLDVLMNQRGGLLGVCGHAAMPDVLRLAESGDARAVLALDLYCYRIRKVIGAYAVALEGLDAVVFGGGVGENASEVRRRVLGPLAWLGLVLDEARNTAHPVDEPVTRAGKTPMAWVVQVNEAIEMANIASEVLGGM